MSQAVNFDKGASILQGQYKDQWKTVYDLFGPPAAQDDYHRPDPSSRPITAVSIFRLYNGVVALNDIQNAVFTDIASWHLDVSTIKRADSLVMQRVTMEFAAGVMENAPENSLPKILTHKVIMGPVVMLTRYQISIKVKTDTLQLPEGKAIVLQQQKQLLQTIAMTQRTLVSATIADAETSLTSYLKGKTYSSLADAMSLSNRTTFIFNKDPKAIYSLNQWVKDFTKVNNPNFDALIVAPGTLNGLVYSNDYETEASRIGDGISYQRLLSGKKSMAKALPGLDIYEDDAVEIQNCETPQGGCLRRNILGGEYYMLDASQHGPENGEDYDCDLETSIEILNITLNTESVIKISETIKNDSIWGDDGNISPVVDDIIRDIASMKATTGMVLENNQIDPFIFKSSSAGSNSRQRPALDGFSVIKLWGNQELGYRSLAQDIKWGQLAALKARKKMREQGVAKALEDGNLLINRLTNISNIESEQFQGFVFACASNPDNYVDGEDFATNTNRDFAQGLYFKAGVHGAGELPYVDHDLLRQQDKKVLYNKINGIKHYLFSVNVSPMNRNTAELNPIKYLSDTDAQLFSDAAGITAANTSDKSLAKNILDTIKKAIKKSSKSQFKRSQEFLQCPLNVLPGIEYQNGLEVSFSEITKKSPFTYRLKTEKGINSVIVQALPTLIYYTPEQIIANVVHDYTSNAEIQQFLLLPDLAEAINEDVLTNRNRKSDTILMQITDILANTPIYGDNLTMNFVAAPAAPYAYGQIHTLRVLADMFRGENKGWGMDILETAFNYVIAYDDKVAQEIINTSPECVLLNDQYTPTFMRTTNTAENIRNNIHFNMIERAKAPFWTKIPRKVTRGPLAGALVSSTSAGSIFNFAAASTDNVNNPTKLGGGVPAVQDTLVNEILSAMGFEGLNYDDNMPMILTRPFDFRNFSNGDLKKTLKKIIESKAFDADTRTGFLNRQKTVELFNAFSEVRTDMGKTYSYLYSRENPASPALPPKFASFFLFEILSLLSDATIRITKSPAITAAEEENIELDYAIAANMLNSILSIIRLSLPPSEGNAVTMDRRLITPLKDRATKLAKELKSRLVSERENIRKNFAGDKLDQFNTDSSNAGKGWINTRMVIDSAQFVELSKRTDAQAVRILNNLLVRPSDKRDLSRPLGALGSDYVLPVDNIDQSRQIYGAMQHASAKNRNMDSDVSPRTVISSPWFYGSANILRQPRATRYVGQRRNTDQQMRDRDDFQSTYDGFDQKFTSDIQNAIYDQIEYVDERGILLPNKVDIVEEKNIKDRVRNIEMNCDDWLARAFAFSRQFSTVTRNSELTWLSKGLPPANTNYLVFRIMAFEADSAIWLKKKQAIELFYEFPHTGVSVDAMKEDLMIKVVAFLGCSISNPNNVFIKESVKCNNYFGGGGADFYPNPEDFNPTSLMTQPFSLIPMRTGSLFNMESARAQGIFSIFGRYFQDYYLYDIPDPNGKIFKMSQQWPSYFFYNKVFGFESMKPSQYVRDAKSFTERKIAASTGNFDGLMYMGSSNLYNPKSGKHDKLNMGDSIVANILSPCLDIMRGAPGIFRTRR